MSIFSRKKTDRFTELLLKQAEYSFEGMQLLLQYVKNPDDALARQVSEMEGQADEVRRILIDELNRTFVTPIDREDIFALSGSVDDVLDYA
jgi:predicted phosphate transport protein (TIGR00153 family)